MSDTPTECPICQHQSSVIKLRDYGERIEIDCSKCGRYEITRTAFDMLTVGRTGDATSAAAMSHAVRRMQRSNERPAIDSKNVKNFAAQPLPNPHQQADNFVLWLGEYLRHPGKTVKPNYEAVASIIGGLDGNDARFISVELIGRELIRGDASSLHLTLEGWARFDELTRATVDSRQAFMAMPFGDEMLEQIFRDHWKPAVAQTGFDLRRLDDNQRAGLIDDRLRVEIRRSRFLISEITGQNRGAYWEAGFAEGLDRPVIYTCRKSEFEDAHFDTNHCLTILWEEHNLYEAAERLKACIRETLPAEAIMADPEP